jgi:UDP-N-acetylglucosamine 2-epimerase (non-hydrolysing)
MSNSKLVLTDSGGMQEETTVLGIPCITLRENTERPVTIAYGTNAVVGTDKELIIEESLKRINSDTSRSDQNTQYPPLWDGKAGQRIVRILVDSSFKS